RPPSIELRVIRPDGTMCWVRRDSDVISDDGGRPATRIAIFLDITGEVALREMKAREGNLRDYVTTAADWYWEAGPDWRFTVVADEARELGIDPDHLIGLDGLAE